MAGLGRSLDKPDELNSFTDRMSNATARKSRAAAAAGKRNRQISAYELRSVAAEFASMCVMNMVQ
jgi:hypothetical protein